MIRFVAALQRGIAPGLLLAAVLAVGTPARAQQIVRGTVIDQESQKPVSGAIISLLTDKRKPTDPGVRTDSLGKFTISLAKTGRFRIQGLRIGYLPVVTAVITVESKDILVYQLEMSQNVTVLAPLSILGHYKPGSSSSDPLDFFEAHRRTGSGRYFTQADIEKMGAQKVTDVIKTLPSATFIAGPAGLSDAVVFRRANTLAPTQSVCVPTIYLDDVRVRVSPFDILNTVPITKVRGVEVYPGPATIPGEYAAPGVCAVIAVWRMPR
jgi:hypothetical protein